MKSLFKLISAALTVVMVLAMFAACAGQNGPATTTAAETKGGADTNADTAATEEQTTEAVSTEAETTEEETTAEETEETPKQLYDVYRWDFNDASDIGWVSSNMTDIIAEEDGSMHLVAKGPDPNITTKKINVTVDCDIVEYIVMRIKNKTDAYTGQLFISTTDSPGPAEAYSYKYEYEYADEDDEWEIIEIDTLDINGWSGSLRSLRLDYTDGGEGDCYVDYIALQTTDEKKAWTGETEEIVDPRAGKQVLYKWDFTKLTAEDMNITSKPKETTEADEGGETDEEEDPRWRFSGGVEDAYVEGGHLVIKIGGQDPFMASPIMDTPFDCEAVSAVVIKVCNKTDMNLGQFFFTSDGSSYSEAGSVRFSFENKGADNEVWEEIVINPKDSTLWEGQLETIRIDPSEAWEGVILIDYCELYG